MPRNFDPESANAPGVELLDIEVIALHADLKELSAESEARQITHTAAQEFAVSDAERAAVPAILALRGYVQAVLEAELEHNNHLGDDSGKVHAALKHFAGRLLHEPSVRLRSLGKAGRAPEGAAAVNALFGASVPIDVRELPDEAPTSSQCPVSNSL